MDTSSILLGIALFLVFFGPILYIVVKGGNSEKKIKKIISSLCEEKGISVKNIEIIGNTILAMDATSGHLVFSNIENPKAHLQFILLQSLKDCRLKTIRPNKKRIDMIGLELVGEEFVKEVVLYREEEESTITDSQACLQTAMTWEKEIRKQLKAS